MRFVFLILLIQFVTSGYAQANIQEYTTHQKAVYSGVHETGICLNIFFKESFEEKENHRTVASAELIDFSFLRSVLTQYHSGFACNIDNLLLAPEPLFRLNRSLLI